MCHIISTPTASPLGELDEAKEREVSFAAKNDELERTVRGGGRGGARARAAAQRQPPARTPHDRP